MKQWLTVGISGATCSGKTTLAENITKAFPGSVNFNQDIYFWNEDSPNHVYVEELQHNNYDVVSSVDFAKMTEDVKQCLAREPEGDVGLLIIEGIMIFNYPPVAELCQRKFFLTLTRDECVRRRIARTYDPPDTPGYFDLCVWPAYEMFYAEIKQNLPETVFLDGADTMSHTFDAVFADIQRTMDKMKATPL